MTAKLIRCLMSAFVIVLVAFGLLAMTATDSSARKHPGASKKSSKSASSRKHSSKASRHKAPRTLSAAEKAGMIQKIRELANSAMVSDKTDANAADIGQNSTSQEIQAELAQAAREEQAEDDVEIDIDQFFKARSGSATSLADPEVVRERQSDFTLFDVSDPETAAKRSDVMQQIIDWLGTQYTFGGVSRSGIDCSAFTREVFRRSFGVDLPRTANMQAQVGETVPKQDLVFGDLVFFKTARYAPITHVGIYIGEGLFANAACSKGVSVASLESTYWKKRYISGKRLFTNSELAARSTANPATMASRN